MDRSGFTDVARIRRLVRASGLDGVVATAPENVTHTSGYYNLDQRLLPEHLHACVWPAEGEPVLIIPARERRLETFIQDVRTHQIYGCGESQEEGLDLLAEALRERGLGRGRIGVDLQQLPGSHLRGLEARLPEATFVDATDAFGRMRLVKTTAEIELLRRAALATERAIALGYAQARPGDTEKSIVDVMDYYTVRLGGEAVAFNVIASGPRLVLGHHRGEPVSIRTGDLLRVDYGGLFDGYFTDLARMAVVGPPSERQRAIYANCVEIQRRCLEALRPGVTGSDLYEVACQAYRAAGLPVTRSMFGHSIGLSVHERPIFCRGDDWALEPGAVVCVENGLTDLEHQERYHLEDMALITSTGHELLSTYTNTSTLFVIDER